VALARGVLPIGVRRTPAGYRNGAGRARHDPFARVWRGNQALWSQDIDAVLGAPLLLRIPGSEELARYAPPRNSINAVPRDPLLGSVV
jgi:hypothetical protein